MKQPVFAHEWSAKKMVAVAQSLVIYWQDCATEIGAKLERMGPGDERYLGLRKKLERDHATAAHNVYMCRIFADDVIECASAGRESWTVQTSDLAWFFPQGAPEQE